MAAGQVAKSKATKATNCNHGDVLYILYFVVIILMFVKPGRPTNATMQWMNLVFWNYCC